MIIKGKYNKALVATDNIESSCIDQIKTLLNCKVFEGESIAIMPDCHSGIGCVVGYTQTTNNKKIVPGLVGCDIGCGMSYIKIPEINLRELDKVIYKYIPSGFDIHKSGSLPSKVTNKVETLVKSLHCLRELLFLLVRRLLYDFRFAE